MAAMSKRRRRPTAPTSEQLPADLSVRARALYANVLRRAPASLPEQLQILLDERRRIGASTRDESAVRKLLMDDDALDCRG